MFLMIGTPPDPTRTIAGEIMKGIEDILLGKLSTEQLQKMSSLLTREIFRRQMEQSLSAQPGSQDIWSLDGRWAKINPDTSS